MWFAQSNHKSTNTLFAQKIAKTPNVICTKIITTVTKFYLHEIVANAQK
jgi:hypothetical protein